MNLKKSDKMIALLGVIILIVAGMAIVIYVPSDGGDDDDDNLVESTKMFDVNCQELSRTAGPDNKDFRVKKKLLGLGAGGGAYSDIVTIDQQNLKSVDFYFDYTDTKAGLLFGMLFKSLGADTLTMTISDAEGNLIKTESIKGSGNTTISVPVGSKISTQSIEAETIGEATAKLEEEYETYDESYQITVTVKYGLWGILREKLGSDSFNMEITYAYYDYSVEEQTEDDILNEGNTIDSEDDDYMAQAVKDMRNKIYNGRGAI